LAGHFGLEAAHEPEGKGPPSPPGPTLEQRLRAIGNTVLAADYMPVGDRETILALCGALMEFEAGNLAY
jgi:hypothetical protein